MNLEHVAINIPAPAEAAKWWGEHFNMKIVMAQDVDPYMHFVLDSSGESMLEFYKNSAAPMPDYPSIDPFNFHVAFTTTEIAADRDRLVAAGATINTDIYDAPGGTLLAFLRDPWGVPFQLVQRGSPLI